MKKILIVEDDQMVANAYKMKLTKSGFEVEIAGDGKKAFDVLEKYVPDFILIDLMMPNMDGFEFLKALKEDKKYKSIPAFVASNLSQKEDIDKAMKLGADDYLVKVELTIQDIADKITKALS